MMNTYTLDPTKQENAAAAATMPPLTMVPPYPQASAPATAPNHAFMPYYMPPNYQYHAYQYPQPQSTAPQAAAKNIRDWLPWSIINLFIGGLIIGFLPLIFSLICRSKKSKNDLNGARTMSTLALVFNILITIIGILSLIAVLIYLFVYLPQLRSHILVDMNQLK